MQELLQTLSDEMISNLIITVSTVAAVAATLAASAVSWYLQKKSRVQQSAADSLSGFAILEQTLREVPTALRFHGITEKELEVAKIDPKELSYFLSNMTTGGIYYRTIDKTHKISLEQLKKKTENAHVNNKWFQNLKDKWTNKGLIQFFQEDGYYGMMFQHQATRNAWAICRCCLAPSDYKSQLDHLSEVYGGPTQELTDYLVLHKATVN